MTVRGPVSGQGLASAKLVIRLSISPKTDHHNGVPNSHRMRAELKAYLGGIQDACFRLWPGNSVTAWGSWMHPLLKKIIVDEAGATAIEYGLIAALISVAAITALIATGGSLNTMFSTVSTALSNAIPGP